MAKLAEMNRKINAVIGSYNMKDAQQLNEMMFVLTTANSNLQLVLAEMNDRNSNIPAATSNDGRIGG